MRVSPVLLRDSKFGKHAMFTKWTKVTHTIGTNVSIAATAFTPRLASLMKAPYVVHVQCGTPAFAISCRRDDLLRGCVDSGGAWVLNAKNSLHWINGDDIAMARPTDVHETSIHAIALAPGLCKPDPTAHAATRCWLLRFARYHTLWVEAALIMPNIEPGLLSVREVGNAALPPPPPPRKRRLDDVQLPPMREGVSGAPRAQVVLPALNMVLTMIEAPTSPYKRKEVELLRVPGSIVKKVP